MTDIQKIKQHLEELSLIRATSIHIIKDEEYRARLIDHIDATIYELSVSISLPLSDLALIYNLPTREVLHILEKQVGKPRPSLVFED